MNLLSPPYEKLVLICINERESGEAACGNRGSADIAAAAKDWVRSRGLKGRVRVTRTRCFGLCSLGPNVCIQPENAWYAGVRMADLEGILERHLGALAPGGPLRLATTPRETLEPAADPGGPIGSGRPGDTKA